MTSASRASARGGAGRCWSSAWGLLIFLVGLPAAAEPDAETRTAARDLATQGAQAFDAEDYERASDFFRRAHELVDAPTIALMQARSLAKLRELLHALDIYEQTARFKLPSSAPEAYVAAVRSAASEVEDVRVRLPRLELTVTGIESGERAEVTIDDKLTPAALLGVERPVDPGLHRFAVRVDGKLRAAREVELLEREHYRIELDAHPVAALPPPVAAKAEPVGNASPVRKAMGYASLGLGVVGLGVGTYTGLVALHRKSDLDAVCHATCPPASASDIDSWRTHRTLSWLSYGVGTAAVATGVLLLTLGGGESAHVALGVHPTGIALSGQL